VDLAGMFEDVLKAAEAKIRGLDGLRPNKYYVQDVNPEYDPNTEYFLRGTYKNSEGNYVGDYSPLPRRYAEMPVPDFSRYEQKPFKTDRETVEEYMNRISVTDVPENLLIRDESGRIIGMKEPRPTYVIPDRRGSQFFAP
tara:strand:+ start:479 stop:898 length:420 start_codon:yes stop_codon:yes gene_type:complete